MAVSNRRLREFLNKAPPLTHGDSTNLETRPCVLVDDRRDTTGWEETARNWAVYARKPPKGEDRELQVFTAREFWRHLRTNVSQNPTTCQVFLNTVAIKKSSSATGGKANNVSDLLIREGTLRLTGSA
jgi:hypothetical protein